MRSTVREDRKAPKMASLELARETLQELAGTEAETVKGGHTGVRSVCHRHTCGYCTRD